jgi:hypothetical protein
MHTPLFVGLFDVESVGRQVIRAVIGATADMRSLPDAEQFRETGTRAAPDGHGAWMEGGRARARPLRPSRGVFRVAQRRIVPPGRGHRLSPALGAMVYCARPPAHGTRLSAT